MSAGKATHLGQVMTAAELDELVAKIRGLTGKDRQARACAIACGWPLGDGPTMSQDTTRRRQQKAAKLPRCFHPNATPYSDKPQYANCPDCHASVMTADLPAFHSRWLEQQKGLDG